MKSYRLAAAEALFADIIWEKEPLRTAELVRLSGEKLHWKRTTTYTVLRRLSERGIFQNVRGTVIALVSRESFYAVQSRFFVEEMFDGSLPAFLASYLAGASLSEKEIRMVRRLLKQCGRKE